MPADPLDDLAGLFGIPAENEALVRARAFVVELEAALAERVPGIERRLARLGAELDECRAAGLAEVGRGVLLQRELAELQPERDALAARVHALEAERDLFEKSYRRVLGKWTDTRDRARDLETALREYGTLLEQADTILDEPLVEGVDYGSIIGRAQRRVRKVRAALASSAACDPEQYSSRVCELGTKGCNVRHSSAATERVEHVCPVCRAERADYEGPNAHLPECPNCGSNKDPVPAATETERT